jgi:hypothetical protein
LSPGSRKHSRNSWLRRNPCIRERSRLVEESGSNAIHDSGAKPITRKPISDSSLKAISIARQRDGDPNVFVTGVERVALDITRQLAFRPEVHLSARRLSMRRVKKFYVSTVCSGD